jgi:hypothetical protein
VQPDGQRRLRVGHAAEDSGSQVMQIICTYFKQGQAFALWLSEAINL